MDIVLSTLASRIETLTGVTIGVGHPNSLNAQVTLWPWRVVRDRHARNTHPPDGRAPKAPLIEVYFLLLTKGGLGDLIRVNEWVEENPVLTLDDRSYMVRDHELTADLQVAICHASAITLQPMASYSIGWWSEGSINPNPLGT